MSERTNEELRDRISLYLYGELEGEERESFERELEASAELREAVTDEERFLRGLHVRRRVDASEALLAHCRQDLMREVYRAERPTGPSAWFSGFWASLTAARLTWQPAAALALLGVGFFGGRATQSLWDRPAEGPAAVANGGQLVARQQGVLDTDPVSVADVQAMPIGPTGLGGGVEIVVEQRQIIRGNANDPRIRELLLNSVASSHSGARLESLEALGRNLDDQETRAALIRAMVEDQNPGVRIKALEALKEHAQDEDVRAALVSAVRADPNPGMRVMAVELLTAEPDREIAGVLQELVATETNSYVRMRCQKALLELNASVDVY
jgi:hypothetical protein